MRTEAWRDLSVRDVVLTITVALVTGVLASAGSSAVLSAVNAERIAWQSGVYVWTVLPAERKTLRWRDCEYAPQVEGVVASGGTAAPEDVKYIFADAGARIDSVAVTRGALWVWGLDEDLQVTSDASSWPSGSLWVGHDLADLLDIGLGVQVDAVQDGASGPVGAVDNVLPSWMPDATLQSDVLVPARPLSDLSACWLRLERWATDDADGIIQAVFGSQVVQSSRYRLPSPGPSITDQYGADAQRANWPLLSLLVLLTAAGVGWSERPYAAVYRAMGVPLWELWWMRTMQALIGLPVVLGIALLAVSIPFLVQGAGIPGWALSQLFRMPVLALCAWVALGPALRVASATTNIQAALQDR